MNALWIILLIFLAVVMTRKTVGGEGNQTRDFTGYDDRFRTEASIESVDWFLLKAIAYQESRFNARAYNPEGYPPPAGNPAFHGENPGGADVSGYQGSFGLGQIYHSNGWSTARAYRPEGDYPGELLDPAVNIKIMARFVGTLISRGFGLETIDVYNIGETKYAAGARNPAYAAAVQSNYEYFLGMSS
jgi:hypothetical protein